MISNTAENSIPRPAGLFYLLSFLFPGVGYITGAIFYGHEGPEPHRFGLNCLKAAVFSQIAAIAFSILLFVSAISFTVIMYIA